MAKIAFVCVGIGRTQSVAALSLNRDDSSAYCQIVTAGNTVVQGGHVYVSSGYSENILAGNAVFGIAFYVELSAAGNSQVVLAEQRGVR